MEEALSRPRQLSQWTERLASARQVRRYLALSGAGYRMGDRFSPVRIRVIETGKRIRAASSIRIVDAIAEITWNKDIFEFAVETRVPFNPKAIANP